MAFSARKVTGFSLLELLIAVAILTSLVTSAAYVFSVSGRIWRDSDQSFRRAFDQYRRVDLATLALTDSIPWLVRDQDGKVGFYFLGRDEGLTLVTGSPIFNPGAPAVVRLFRERDANQKWQVVYEEASLSGTRLRSADQVLPFRHRLVIASGLSDVSFRYFGWPSLEAYSGAEDGAVADGRQWFNEYDGLKRSYHPEKIALSMSNDEIVFPVPSRISSVLSRSIDPSI
jgi:prepilin-type N-terminal cleavage/methylation domain-containing protein